MGRSDKTETQTNLGWSDLAQQLSTVELDEVSIVRAQRLVRHSGLDGFAGANEIRSLSTNIHHGVLLKN